MQNERKDNKNKRVEYMDRFSMKAILLFLFLTISIVPMIMNVDAYVPVTYTCCYDYIYSDGIKLNGFENTDNSGIQLDGFENLSNWIVSGTGASQQVDTINFEEGNQSLKLIATNGNRTNTDKVINNNFSTTDNFAIWIYIYDINTFDHITLYFTSTGTLWNKYFSRGIYPPNFKTGWNKIIFNKNDFGNTGGESWNNTMNRIRITVWPVSSQNTNASLDNLRTDVTNDWIAGVNSSQDADTINFKEDQQGLKLIATNGTSAYMDLSINNSFSTTNNFAIWTYIDNASNLQNMYIYFTSTGTKYNKYFYHAVPGVNGVKTGWNKFVFNKNDFINNGGENWNNVMNRTRLRIYPVGTTNVNVTFDDLRYDMTGQRAKLMIGFDDGDLSAYTNAYPILSANNQPGISFVVTSKIGIDGYMNLGNLRTLQSTGWDISSHTVNHTDLATANDSAQISALNDSYDWLVGNKFQKSAGFIAYPFGTFNDAVIDKVKKRYIFGRSVVHESVQQHFTQTDDAIRYIQRITEAYSTTTVQSIKNSINDTINAKLLGILVFHDIVDSSPSTYQYRTSDLKAISDYIKSRSDDVDVITYSDYIIPNINSFTPVINKTTRIYSNGSTILITNNKYDEYMPNMTVKPSSGYTEVGITIYDETGGLIEFNESSPNSNLQVSYEIGDRIPNQPYRVVIYWANGTKYQDFNISADSTGYIKYISEGFGDSRYQEINIIPRRSSFDIFYNVI